MSIKALTLRVLAAGGVAVAFAASPAVASGAGSTHVDGLLELDESGACPADLNAAATYVVSGSLEGCWYVDTFNVDHANNAGGFVATGTEHFDGCLDARCGTLH